MYEIEQVWDLNEEGFYSLRGGSNWASIEGHASEWLAIASAIKARRRESFKRVAVATGTGPGFAVTLWSPRNAASDRDHVELDADEADALAAQIVACLRGHGESCVTTGFDPIHAGM